MDFNGNAEQWRGAWSCQAAQRPRGIAKLTVFCPFECNGIITEIENKNEPITFSIEFTMMEADETFIVVMAIMKVEMPLGSYERREKDREKNARNRNKADLQANGHKDVGL